MKYESDRRSSLFLHPLLHERKLSCLYVAAVSGVRAASCQTRLYLLAQGRDLVSKTDIEKIEKRKERRR